MCGNPRAQKDLLNLSPDVTTCSKILVNLWPTSPPRRKLRAVAHLQAAAPAATSEFKSLPRPRQMLKHSLYLFMTGGLACSALVLSSIAWHLRFRSYVCSIFAVILSCACELQTYLEPLAKPCSANHWQMFTSKRFAKLAEGAGVLVKVWWDPAKC